MRLTQNYSVLHVPILVIQTSLPTSLPKVFHSGIKEISTLKSYIYILFLIKLSADISDSSFLLDSLSKAKVFPNVSAGNSIVSYFLKDFKM